MNEASSEEQVKQPVEEHETKMRRSLEELEDALIAAQKAASKVHVQVPTYTGVRSDIAAHFLSGSSTHNETVGDVVRRCLEPVRQRLNAVYAAEIRRQRGRE